MGISEEVCNTEKEELLVSDTPEIGLEQFDLGIEGFRQSIRGTIVIKI